MTVEAAIQTLRAVGDLTVEGGTIVCYPPDPAVEPIATALETLRRNKPAALRLLRAVEWPPESIEGERRFGVASARLYPFLDRRVSTPDGQGKLLQVFEGRVIVHFEGEPRTREYLPEEIAIYAD